VDAQPRAQHLIRRAWRQADRRHADLLAVFETPAWARSGPEERRVLEENLRFAEDRGATVLRVAGQDVAKTLAQVANNKNISSIVVGHSCHGRLHEFLRGSIASNLLRLVRGVDVHVVADEAERG
jgi:two-component system sensor histidine kinase KdpD